MTWVDRMVWREANHDCRDDYREEEDVGQYDDPNPPEVREETEEEQSFWAHWLTYAQRVDLARADWYCGTCKSDPWECVCAEEERSERMHEFRGGRATW